METTSDQPLADRVALVTGGSRGLGRETALAFARAGADVVIASRKLEACEALARKVTEETGRRALPVACHVGRWEDLDRLVETTYRAFGRVDVLVNNAGMSPYYESVVDVSEELWRKVLDVNLMGPFRLTALVGARMAAGDGGSIINVSSVTSLRPAVDGIPYAAAKAGVNALTVAFARLLGPKVRVNAVLPGIFMTDVSASWDPEAVAARVDAFALRRAAQPEEIVGTMLYLATDASRYTTGALIAVDGGYADPPPAR